MLMDSTALQGCTLGLRAAGRFPPCPSFALPRISHLSPLLLSPPRSSRSLGNPIHSVCVHVKSLPPSYTTVLIRICKATLRYSECTKQHPALRSRRPFVRKAATPQFSGLHSRQIDSAAGNRKSGGSITQLERHVASRPPRFFWVKPYWIGLDVLVNEGDSFEGRKDV
ncbi:hypothetical protein BU26DRAFT_73309 [Trematosphaeria pertusa]|uniref:Uncharacterized protein n=1 Tax=Trematosphaeria pertusa TaxID=390896 RepID=A0A6A6I810_9PLEO|nr:uncharacterized protein BU26DRAFT_73309 [Trematosphaeria pertusa]KAF2245663.1 hypothetical protein BU26DRAFT_73309 [Trematosphaeria pertusa]